MTSQIYYQIMIPPPFEQASCSLNKSRNPTQLTAKSPSTRHVFPSHTSSPLPPYSRFPHPFGQWNSRRLRIPLIRTFIRRLRRIESARFQSLHPRFEKACFFDKQCFHIATQVYRRGFEEHSTTGMQERHMERPGQTASTPDCEELYAPSLNLGRVRITR